VSRSVLFIFFGGLLATQVSYWADLPILSPGCEEQIVTLVWPAVSASLRGGNFDVGSIITQVIGGGAGGAVLTAIVGAIKNKTT